VPMLANAELRDDSVIGADDVSHLDCGRRDGRLDERAWRQVVKFNVDAVIGPTTRRRKHIASVRQPHRCHPVVQP
jgi:hypothetical protein